MVLAFMLSAWSCRARRLFAVSFECRPAALTSGCLTTLDPKLSLESDKVLRSAFVVLRLPSAGRLSLPALCFVGPSAYSRPRRGAKPPRSPVTLPHPITRNNLPEALLTFASRPCISSTTVPAGSVLPACSCSRRMLAGFMGYRTKKPTSPGDCDSP